MCRICFLLDRRESKTRWNDRIQKCGEKALNYTYFLYRNRRKWAKLRLHNRQFNAHDVKRVCKKVSDAITNVSVVSEGINIMAIRACVFWWTPKIMLELQPCFFININDLAIPLFAVCYFLVLFKRAESLRLHFWCFVKDAFPHIFSQPDEIDTPWMLKSQVSESIPHSTERSGHVWTHIQLPKKQKPKLCILCVSSSLWLCRYDGLTPHAIKVKATVTERLMHLRMQPMSNGIGHLFTALAVIWSKTLRTNSAVVKAVT